MLIFARNAHDLRSQLRLQLYGVVLLVLVSLFLGLTVAKYQKVFKPVVLVTLQAERAGLQLNQYGDVRMHGVLVGKVREVTQEGNGAVIRLALDPEVVDVVPADVKARIFPTTLFGQKYISLVPPKNPADEHISEGDVIPQDRSEVAAEISRVLDRLYPLLRAVKPTELAFTLNAMATALQGRGEELGQTLERMDAYVTRLNEHLPALREDIRLLADFAETYTQAAPDLLEILRNMTVTSRTIVAKKQEMKAFYRDVSGVAGTGQRVLEANSQRIIRLGEVARPVLNLLATYAPEYPCLLKGIDRYEERLAKTFKNDKIQMTVEFGPQTTGYTKEDAPVYGEQGHGPWCRGLPNNPPVPYQGTPLEDGSNKDSASPFLLPLGRSVSAGLTGPASGYAGTEAEQKVVNSLVAPVMNVPAKQVPDITTLLYGPMVRGNVVNAR